MDSRDRRIEALSVATKQAIKNLGVKRTGSGIPKPTMEQTREIKALEANWHRAFLKIYHEAE